MSDRRRDGYREYDWEWEHARGGTPGGGRLREPERKREDGRSVRSTGRRRPKGRPAAGRTGGRTGGRRRRSVAVLVLFLAVGVLILAGIVGDSVGEGGAGGDGGVPFELLPVFPAGLSPGAERAVTFPAGDAPVPTTEPGPGPG